MTSPDRVVAVVVITKGESLDGALIVYNGTIYPTDDLVSNTQKLLLTNELIDRGLFDPDHQDTVFLRTIDLIPVQAGSGQIEIAVLESHGDATLGGTFESDLNDGSPLDRFQATEVHYDLPVADAGGPYSAECQGSQTSLPMDGTGSRPAHNGALAYYWSSACPGASFDNATSPTPSLTLDTSSGGHLSCGAKLVVAEGVLGSGSSTGVSIVDTTSPRIACPPDVIVECSAYGGTPKTDSQLTQFLAGASASDICDPRVGVSDDAPALFPLGNTEVTFRALDASGNAASCTASVRVLDRLAPRVMVHMTPHSLWPPNHKLIGVHADVAAIDVCDPSLVLQLAEVSSSEPDNGLERGDMAPDIVGAELGTYDRDVSLRAERSGGGRGRIYTICYRGVDKSGNSTTACDSVVVPHDQGH